MPRQKRKTKEDDRNKEASGTWANPNNDYICYNFTLSRQRKIWLWTSRLYGGFREKYIWESTRDSWKVKQKELRGRDTNSLGPPNYKTKHMIISNPDKEEDIKLCTQKRNSLQI